MYLDLIHNLTLLVAISIVSGFIENHWIRRERLGFVLQGLLFGGAAVLGMLRPFVPGPGLAFDGRSIIVSLCALFFGPWAGAVATALTVACGLLTDGSGAVTGSLVVLSSAAIGIFAHFRLKPLANPPSARSLYLFGLFVHLAMLALMFTLPAGAGAAKVAGIGIPVIILYPLATILVGKILSDRIIARQAIKALKRKEERYEQLFGASNDAVMVHLLQDGESGAFTEVNDVACARLGYTREELLTLTPADIDAPGMDDARNRAVKTLAMSNHMVFETSHVKKSGQTIPVEISSSAFESGGERYAMSIARDISDRRAAEDALRQSEEKYRTVVEHTHDGIFVSKGDRFIFVNGRMTEITGYPKEELYTMNPLDLPVPEDREYVVEIARKRNQGEMVPITYGTRITANDGTVKHLELAVSPISYEGDYASLAVVRDVTDRKEAEKALAAIVTSIAGVTGQECLDHIVENITSWLGADCAVIGEITPDRKEMTALSMKLDGEMTAGCSYMLEGTPCHDVVTQNGFRFLPRDVRTLYPRGLVLQELRIEGYVGTPLRHPDGTPLGVICILFRSPVRAMPLLPQILDVLASKAAAEVGRMRAQETIQASLKEKEILLKEIHHRVKNNLQVISSLLSMQSRHVRDPEDSDSFQASMDRVRSMALIHDRLYRSENLASIYFPGYAEDLLRDLLSIYAFDRRIELNIDVAPVALDIDSAVPLGLMLNELVSNCFKHAFPEHTDGSITVAVREQGNQIVLTVSDDGVGFPEHIDFTNTESLGMQLVITLVEQLEGTIELVRARGTEFRVTFTRGA